MNWIPDPAEPGISRSWCYFERVRVYAWIYSGKDYLYHAHTMPFPSRSLCGAHESRTGETKTPGAGSCRACWLAMPPEHVPTAIAKVLR